MQKAEAKEGNGAFQWEDKVWEKRTSWRLEEIINLSEL